MTISEFINEMEANHKIVVEKIMKIITKYEPNLTPKIIKTMGKEMIGYEQEGVFKYALASHPKHLSLHNMVMYCYPELNNQFIKEIKNAKFRKGCINFIKLDNFSYETIEKLIEESAKFEYPTKQQLKNK